MCVCVCVCVCVSMHVCACVCVAFRMLLIRSYRMLVELSYPCTHIPIGTRTQHEYTCLGVDFEAVFGGFIGGWCANRGGNSTCGGRGDLTDDGFLWNGMDM